MRTRPGFNSMSESGVSPAAQRPLPVLRSFLLLATLWACAGWAASATTPSARLLSTGASFCDQGCAIADLDGDGRPDLAVVKSEGWGPNGFRYRIDLHLTSRAGGSSFRVFAQRGGLRITPRDVNGDWELDLIITSAWSYTPIGVWINDGHGRFVRSDPKLDFPPALGKGPRLLSESAGEVFQAAVPESHRSWPDRSSGPSLHKETPTGHLTFQPCGLRLPSSSSRRSRSRGPPPLFWQPGSTPNAPIA